MRHDILLLGVLAATLSGTPLRAQTADFGDTPTTPAKPKPKAAKHAPAPAAKSAATPAKSAPAPAKPTLPAVPPAPPPPPTLPPPIVVPMRPVPPPVPPGVSADAVGQATTTKDGLRITFGPGSSDLNPKTEAAIRDLVHGAPPFATTTFSIVAVAPGTDEDPSTPRRLSLSRALAVRSVLITEGIASPRIYVKAMGASALALAGGPPDRVDVSVAGAPPPTSPPAGKTP